MACYIWDESYFEIGSCITWIIAMWFVADSISKKKNYLLNQFSKYSLPLYLMNGYLLVISRTIVVSK